MRYIIVDDEHFAHDIIQGYCDQMPNMHFVKSCYDAVEALQCLKEEKVDLIFLDINMPKLSGFDFLRTLPTPPKVIVTTAYQEFALEGYELDVVDYLLKPVSFGRFIKAMNKVGTIEQSEKPTNITVSSSEDNSYVFLRSNKRYFQVDLKNILYVESSGNYCKIITIDNEIVIRESISDLINKLPSPTFIQVHKSFIVSRTHIKSIAGNRIQIKGNEVPIGKHYKAIVDDLLKGSI